MYISWGHRKHIRFLSLGSRWALEWRGIVVLSLYAWTCDNGGTYTTVINSPYPWLNLHCLYISPAFSVLLLECYPGTYVHCITTCAPIAPNIHIYVSFWNVVKENLHIVLVEIWVTKDSMTLISLCCSGRIKQQIHGPWRSAEIGAVSCAALFNCYILVWPLDKLWQDQYSLDIQMYCFPVGWWLMQTQISSHIILDVQVVLVIISSTKDSYISC